jgi:hypothetical protein
VNVEYASGSTGLGTRNSGLGSGVSGLGSRVSGLGSRVSGLGSRVSGLGSRVSGLGSRVSCLASQISCLGSPVSILGLRPRVRVLGIGSRVLGLGSLVSCLGSRVSGSRWVRTSYSTSACFRTVAVAALGGVGSSTVQTDRQRDWVENEFRGECAQLLGEMADIGGEHKLVFLRKHSTDACKSQHRMQTTGTAYTRVQARGRNVGARLRAVAGDSAKGGG